MHKPELHPSEEGTVMTDTTDVDPAGQGKHDGPAARLAADIALGSVRAEGGEPSREVIDLIDRSVAGNLTPAEVVRLTVERHRRP
jgi:hypothetical protein